MNELKTTVRKTALALSTTLLFALSACSELEGDSASTADTSDEFDSNSRENVLSKRHAARFLNQATFGATRDSTIEARLLGREAWLNQQFTMPVTQTHLERVKDLPYPATGFNENTSFGEMFGSEYIVNNTWESYITAEDQLRKRVGAALNQIFVINSRIASIGIRSNQNAAASYLDMLESNAFGNFRDILYDTSRHAAMGHYLSFFKNNKATYDSNGVEITVPDENYAREILQLFSIGLYELNNNGTLKLDKNGDPIETYSQDDIFNLARVFTSWTYITRGNYTADQYRVEKLDQPMRSVAANHSPEEKSFLGVTIPANTNAYTSLDIAIDTIFNHSNVGPFISKQLIQRLVTSNPSPNYVDRVSSIFNDNGLGVRGDMQAVISAILLDEEAKSINIENTNLGTYRGKLREPMIRLTAIARALTYESKTDIYPIASLTDSSHGLAQSPFKSPSVFNFYRPGYTPPNSEISDAGLVAPEFQIVTGSAIPGSINLINEFIERGEDVFSADWEYLQNRAKNPENLVSYLNILLTAKEMTDIEITNTENVVSAIPITKLTERVKAAMQIVAASPSFLVQK